MNRSALCIKMLNLLNSRGKLSREELAKELETNVRNIGEFKKELETAGYVIKSTSGKDGGYELVKEKLFPALALDDKEVQSLNNGLNFLKANNFIEFNQYQRAMDKIKGSINNPGQLEKVGNIHYIKYRKHYSTKELEISELIQTAINQSIVVEIDYRKLADNEFQKRMIQPYELLEYRSGLYVLAYDVTPNKIKMFKTFKINENRISSARLTKHRFTRDIDFKTTDHIGENGLFKQVYEVKLEISGKSAQSLIEREVGMACDITYENDKAYCDVVFDNEIAMYSFILSLGAEGKVLEPETVRNKVITILRKSLNNYL